MVDKKTVSVVLMGGLGNQMFQLAVAYAYATTMGAMLKVPRKKLMNDKRGIYWNTMLCNWAPYLVDSLESNMTLIKEPDNGATKYMELPTSFMDNNGYMLYGYFQTAKYFSKYATDLYKLFMPQTIREQVNDKYKLLIDNCDRAVVVHARRTDYLNYKDIHNPLSVEYYNAAAKHMNSIIAKPVYLLFSDDSQFWTENIDKIAEMKDKTYLIVDEKDEVSTLLLMSMFKNYIMANSSFSYWAVWLASQTTKTNAIAPKDWFGPAGPKDWQDIYGADWRLV